MKPIFYIIILIFAAIIYKQYAIRQMPGKTQIARPKPVTNPAVKTKPVTAPNNNGTQSAL